MFLEAHNPGEAKTYCCPSSCHREAWLQQFKHCTTVGTKIPHIARFWSWIAHVIPDVSYFLNAILHQKRQYWTFGPGCASLFSLQCMTCWNISQCLVFYWTLLWVPATKWPFSDYLSVPPHFSLCLSTLSTVHYYSFLPAVLAFRSSSYAPRPSPVLRRMPALVSWYWCGVKQATWCCPLLSALPLFHASPKDQMASTLDQDVVFDQWWDQALEIALSQPRLSFWMPKCDWMQTPMPQTTWFMTLTTPRPPCSFLSNAFNPLWNITGTRMGAASLHHGSIHPVQWGVVGQVQQSKRITIWRIYCLGRPTVQKRDFWRYRQW